MKKLKIFVWIAMLFILQLTLAHYLTVSGIEAMFILPFIAAFALLEEDFRYTVMVGAICGICTGSLMESVWAAVLRCGDSSSSAVTTGTSVLSLMRMDH